MASIERLRAGAAGRRDFRGRARGRPRVILQSMRAGANEFFTWPPAEETFHGAVRRTAGAPRNRRRARAPSATTLVFFGAKGGAGTTTLAVNCGVELARLSKKSTVIVDLKPGLGEVALFLGVRPRYSLLDAIDNLHRLDREFLRELVVKHKSGLEILAGSDQFDRPGRPDGGAIEELFRLLARQYEYILVDAGSQINSVHGRGAVRRRHDASSSPTRTSRRSATRSGCSIASGSSARAASASACCSTAPRSRIPIPPKQIEGALGHPIHHTFPSDYKTVSTALNSGVPLALTGNTDIAAQFDQLHAPDHRVRAPAPAAGAGASCTGSASTASRLVW